MIISVKKYPWQCIECKSCGICGTSDNDVSTHLADIFFVHSSINCCQKKGTGQRADERLDNSPW